MAYQSKLPSSPGCLHVVDPSILRNWQDLIQSSSKPPLGSQCTVCTALLLPSLGEAESWDFFLSIHSVLERSGVMVSGSPNCCFCFLPGCQVIVDSCKLQEWQDQSQFSCDPPWKSWLTGCVNQSFYLMIKTKN